MYYNKEINWLKVLKNKKVYIFGAGVVGRNCARKLVNLDIRVEGFIDNNINLSGQAVNDMPVLIPSLTELSMIDSSTMIVICSGAEKAIIKQLIELNLFNYITYSQLDFGGGAEHYGKEYFAWQKEIGKENKKIKKSFFHAFIDDEMNVVEFGCGGGFLLQTIDSTNKIGIEINPYAREFCHQEGLKCVEKPEEVEDEWADIIISSHALEHVEEPLHTLKVLYRKLKNNGKIVFTVPCEARDVDYEKSDINNHLWAWNCMTFGNLFKAAGFYVLSVEKKDTFWPQGYETIRSEVSDELFSEICKLEGITAEKGNLVIIAEK